MMTITAVLMNDASGERYVPAEAIPAHATSVQFNGTAYVVYEGDEPPAPANSTEPEEMPVEE